MEMFDLCYRRKVSFVENENFFLPVASDSLDPHMDWGHPINIF